MNSRPSTVPAEGTKHTPGILCVFGEAAPSHGCACANCSGVKDLLACHAELLEALRAMTRLTEVLADDTTEKEVGYGGKTVRENIHDAKALIAKAEGQ